MATLAQPIAKMRVEKKVKFAHVLPALILFYSFFFPPEIDIDIGPLRLGVYRLALFALTPYVAVTILNGTLRLKLVDAIMTVCAGWIILSFSVVYNWRTGLESGGGIAADMLVSYLLGRATIRSFGHVRLLLLGILPGLIVTSGLLAIESLSGKLLIRPTLQNIFGGSGDHQTALRYEYRQGLLRGYSVFTHPIHAGVFLSSFISLYLVFFHQKIVKISGIFVGFLSIFSMSSAAFLGIILNFGLLIYDRMQARISDIGWGAFLIGGGIFLALVQLFSSSGLISVVYRYLTLNPSTGYFRTLIWKYASEEAMRNPVFGIGYEEYYRPAWMFTASIDAHYLFMAVSYGILPAFLYLFIALYCIYSLSRRSVQAQTTASRNRYVGLAIFMSVILLLMFTVTFWDVMLAWWNFILGMVISIIALRSNLNYRPTSR